jgi:3-hydroxyisobutyrate dehydrogenase-like beta-hydroxyacid dehydrogenase
MTSYQNSSDSRVVGWIGLGKMGLPMSENLIKSGYKLVVYDKITEISGQLAGESVKAAASPEKVAQESDLIISTIPDDQALIDITLGPEGIFKTIKNGSIFVDMSTVSAGVSQRVAEAAVKYGVNYLRAPVSGSTVFAKEAKLTVLASGPKNSFESLTDLFKLLAAKTLYVGSGEEARYIKLLINMIVGISAAMTAEALTFGRKGGLDWNQMLDIIDSSVARSNLIGFKIPPLKERDFAPAFRITQMCKDFDIILNTGNQIETFMPLTSLVREFMSAMKANGSGDLDYFGLVKLWEQMSGI